MHYYRYSAREPLNRFIESFWIYDGFEPEHRFERVLSSGTVEIVANLDEQPVRVYDASDGKLAGEYGSAIVSGVHSRPFGIDTIQQRRMIGVHFRPGGAYPFLDGSAAALFQQHVTFKQIWNRDGCELQTQLMEATGHRERIRIFEQFFLRRLETPCRRHPAVDSALGHFLSAHGCVNVAETVEDSGLSARRFVEVFTREVGLAPKLFCRIQRFQHCMQIIEQGSFHSLADLALSAGYYDQAHLTRDFNEFCGTTPARMLDLRQGTIESIPTDERGQILPIPFDGCVT